jgi:hypothetical protein
VLGREPGDRAKVNYDEAARGLAEFIGHVGCAAEQLAAIKAKLRNHVYDAVGVGVMTAMRPEEATRIGGYPRRKIQHRWINIVTREAH